MFLVTTNRVHIANKSSLNPIGFPPARKKNYPNAKSIRTLCKTGNKGGLRRPEECQERGDAKTFRGEKLPAGCWPGSPPPGGGATLVTKTLTLILTPFSNREKGILKRCAGVGGGTLQTPVLPLRKPPRKRAARAAVKVGLNPRATIDTNVPNIPALRGGQGS